MQCYWDAPTLAHRLRARRTALRHQQRCAILALAPADSETLDVSGAIAARRAAWRIGSATPRIMQWLVAGMTLLLGLDVTAIVVAFGPSPVALALCACAAGVSVRMFRDVDRMRRVCAATTHGRCPGCGYDLGGLDGGVCGAGPARCPECGAAWPLLPPALPG